MNKKLWLKIGLTLSIFLTAYFSNDLLGYRICVNTTASVPYKYFLARKKSRDLKVGDFVTFNSEKHRIIFLKQVKGVSGDKIDYKEGSVFVANNDCGRVLEKSPSSGTKYNPIETKEVPKGFVYLYAPHTNSFDSRYHEFGLVKESQIGEILWPLW
jgi:conjugal transfer pilin signal peptidase TrbI